MRTIPCSRDGRHTQRGFASAISMSLIAVGLLVALTTALLYQRGATDTSASKDRVDAQTVLAQFLNYYSAVGKLQQSGVAMASITNDTNATNGLVGPVTGLLTQTVPPTALATTTAPAGFWVYRAGMKLPGIGTAAGIDYAFVVRGLKSTVCDQINYLLTGTASTTALTTAFGVKANFIAAATTAALGVDTLVVDMTTETPLTGKGQGCFQTKETSPDTPEYVFYGVVVAQ
jgi:hypothetical protein